MSVFHLFKYEMMYKCINKAAAFPVGRMEGGVLWDEGGGEEGQAGPFEKAETMKLSPINLVKRKNCLLTLFLVGLRFINHGLACLHRPGELSLCSLAFPWDGGVWVTPNPAALPGVMHFTSSYGLL